MIHIFAQDLQIKFRANAANEYKPDAMTIDKYYDVIGYKNAKKISKDEHGKSIESENFSFIFIDDKNRPSYIASWNVEVEKKGSRTGLEAFDSIKSKKL